MKSIKFGLLRHFKRAEKVVAEDEELPEVVVVVGVVNQMVFGAHSKQP